MAAICDKWKEARFLWMRLRRMDRSCWSFESEILSHSYLIHDSSCPTVRGPSCRIFVQVGGSRTCTLWPRSHAVVRRVSSCPAGTSSGRQHMSLPNLYVPLSRSGVVTDLCARNPLPHRCWLLIFVQGTIWKVFFLSVHLRPRVQINQQYFWV